MDVDKTQSKQFKLIRLFALLMLVVAPIIYLVIAGLKQVEEKTGGEHDIMFYMLLIVGLCQPLAIPIIERVQIANYRKEKLSNDSAAKYLTVMFLTRFAIIEAIYIWGLVLFFVTGDLTRAMLFFPIGAAWSAIFWPREERIMRTLKRLEAE